MVDSTKEFKIWLPRTQNPYYSIEIDGVDVTTEVLDAEFTNGILGIECPCKVTLIDPNGTYAKLYGGGETIEFFLDFVDGTTSSWKGTLETPKKKFGETYLLELIGSNYQSDLLDITVTEEYIDTPADDVLKDIINKYLTGYTTTNVATSDDNLTIKWNNKPLYDCIIDICSNVGFDCYVDTDKDVHFFEQESISNTNESIVWNNNLREIISFGTDNIDIKNRIIVYGEDETGLPIVYQVDNAASQATYGVKEKVIKDSSIRTYEQAKGQGDGILAQEKEKSNKGEFRCLLLPYLNPGDMIWTTHPIQDIHGEYRIIQYTHKIHGQETNVIISKIKTIPGLFKDRKKAELATENITNPYKMTGSLNLTFDDDTEYDAVASSGVETSEGKLKMESGVGTGIMVSNRRTEANNITTVHLKIIGDYLAGATYKISTNDGGTYEDVNLEEEIILNSSGKNLRLKITITEENTRVDSVVVMYK